MDYQQLAEQFTKWYYNMLNTHHPASQSTPEPFGPEHFFSDSTAKITITHHIDEFQQTRGAEETCQKLIELVTTQQALFQPNTNTDSLGIKVESHGLVVVNVSGTIHSIHSVVGVFEQQFGLAQDPCSDGNYKIKFTVLHCRQPTTTPSLTQPVHYSIGV